MKILNKTLYLFFLFFISSQIISDNSLDDVLNKIYIKNKIKTDSLISFKKGSTLYFFNKEKKHNICFFMNSSKVIKIKIDNIPSGKIKKGNVDFVGNLNQFDIDIENSFNILIKDKLYFVIPINISNCNGSFCRIFSCLLISIKSKTIYFFSNNEIVERNYFRMDDQGNFIYLNIDNSYSNPEMFTNWQKKDSDFYLKITSLRLNEKEKKWIIENHENHERRLILKTENQFNTENCIKIQNNWE